jgi:tRNA A37 methylthiotransferase MiaB
VSREPAGAVAEVRRLFEAGYAEVGISGINLRHFGRDLDPPIDLWDFLGRIETELSGEWAGRARIRLSSLDPAQLGPKALDVLGGSKLVCPHLHLSLQSLSPKVLKAMNRGHYGPGEIMDFLSSLSDVWPVYGLGADLIAGFPGETEQDHLLTMNALRAMPLTYAHVFPYSRRPGTLAASMPGQVNKEDAKSRAGALRDLASGKRREFLKKLSTLEQVNVVIESETPAQGICEYYARCALRGVPPGSGIGGICPARPVSAGDNGLITEPMA